MIGHLGLVVSRVGTLSYPETLFVNKVQFNRICQVVITVSQMIACVHLFLLLHLLTGHLYVVSRKSFRGQRWSCQLGVGALPFQSAGVGMVDLPANRPIVRSPSSG